MDHTGTLNEGNYNIPNREESFREQVQVILAESIMRLIKDGLTVEEAYFQARHEVYDVYAVRGDRLFNQPLSELV